MPDGIDKLGLFIGAGILLNLTPGPDVLYIVTQSLKRGWRVGAVAALGISAGCFVHIGAAALGLSALLAASSTAFMLLKFLGAAYLVYLGWTMVARSKTDLEAHSPSFQPATLTGIGHTSAKKVFTRGFWTNVLNPKVALFFLAFVPQFIAPDAPNKTFLFLLLGLLFNVNCLWVGVGYAILAGAASRHFSALRRGVLWLERLAGLIFVGFGLKLALTDNPVG